MRFISWNVNGLRAARGKGFDEIFLALSPDFFCLQETKLQQGQIDMAFPGYESYWSYAEKKGYSGTAIFTRHTPLFDWSVEQFSAEGWELRDVTHDLHANGLVGILTGYEAKFVSQGMKINRLAAVKGERTKTLSDGEVPRLRNASLCDARGYEESMETHARMEGGQ